MKWMWRLTQAPNSPCSMPDQLQHCMDPCIMLMKWKSCPIHKTKSKFESHSHRAVWAFIHNGKSLEGAHDSLVNARAQSDLLLHPWFVPHINRTNSFAPIDKIFGANKLSKLKRADQLCHRLGLGWRQ